MQYGETNSIFTVDMVQKKYIVTDFGAQVLQLNQNQNFKYKKIKRKRKYEEIDEEEE